MGRGAEKHCPLIELKIRVLTLDVPYQLRRHVVNQGKVGYQARWCFGASKKVNG
jgi:hypothetical protein